MLRFRAVLIPACIPPVFSIAMAVVCVVTAVVVWVLVLGNK